MDREIKFRAYSKKFKRMFDVVSIDFELETVCLKIPDIMNYDIILCEFEEVDLMQYTGLKDKNGKEIYEGDIAKTTFCFPNQNEERIGLVYFDYTDLQWQLGEPCDWCSFSKEKFEECEVIGNIYENPELLERNE